MSFGRWSKSEGRRGDRGFHSPANRTRLDELLVDSVFPGRAASARLIGTAQGETFCHAPSALRCGVSARTPWPRPCSVERSRGICPNGCFGRRCPELFRHSTVTHYQREYAPPGGWDRREVQRSSSLSEVETTAQPDLFYADHPRLPFHRCTTVCNQTGGFRD